MQSTLPSSLPSSFTCTKLEAVSSQEKIAEMMQEMLTRNYCPLLLVRRDVHTALPHGSPL
jgi:hypothetical protein